MQYKTRVFAVVITFVVLIFICELAFAKVFFDKNKEPNTIVSLEQSKKPLSASETQEPAKPPIVNDISNVNNNLTIKKFDDSLIEKIPAMDREKYEFTTFAYGNGSMFFAGCDRHDKSTGIIYRINPDPSGLNPDVKEYAFPGKGEITFDDAEDNDSILTFTCINESKGYFETKSDNTVFQNYYLKVLKENPYLDSNTYDFQDLKESKVHLNKNDAIEKACMKASIDNIINQSKKVSAVLVKYTNKTAPELPGTDIILQDVPVWVVTFSGVDEVRTGGKSIVEDPENAASEHVLADMHVFIGANSGIWLGSVSHTSLLQSSQPH